MSMVNIFITSELIENMENSIKEIENKTKEADGNNYKAYFIYNYSILEGALFESLRHFLLSFPYKMFNKSLEINANTLERNDIIGALVEKYVRNISKTKMYSFLIEYCKHFEISTNKFSGDKKLIKSAVDMRNSIVHRNRNIINKDYHKAPDDLDHEKFDLATFNNYSNTFVRVLKLICQEISSKYNNYTKEYLLRESWKYVFPSGILSFDLIWRIGHNGIQIKADEAKKNIQSASSTEKFLLFLWFSQYSPSLNQEYFLFKELPMLVSMTRNTKEKIRFTLSLFEHYPYLLNGDNY